MTPYALPIDAWVSNMLFLGLGLVVGYVIRIIMEMK